MSTIFARWLVRARAASSWTSLNEVLLRDEMGLERDTRKFKFGDGSTRWNDLAYSGGGEDLTIEALAALIGTDPATIRDALELGTASQADSVDFDAAGAAAAAQVAAIAAAATDATTKANSAQAAATAAAATDATTKAAAAQAAAQAFAIQRGNHTGTQAQSTIVNLVSDLALKADLVAGLIPTSQIPAIAITEYLGAVASQAAMLALVGQKGDWANRTDLGTMWVITGNDPTQLADWTAINYPASPVTSVNGQVGVVVLGKSDVGLGNVTNDVQTKAAVVPNTAPSAGQLLVGNAGGTAYAPVSASGDATLTSLGVWTLAAQAIADRTHAATGKTTPVDADELPLVDSAASNVLKKLTWANMKASMAAASAAVLTTARNIGGVSFNGSADIEPGVSEVAVTTGITLGLTHRNKILTQTHASPQTIAIPAQSSVTWVGPTTIIILAYGSGTCTLDADPGVTLNGVSGGAVALNRYQNAVLRWISADVWVVSGTSADVA